MSNPVTFGGLWKQIRRLFILWLVLAIVAALAATGRKYMSLPARFQASAQLCLDYPGAENGTDLNGNRFDIRTIKDENVIRSAAEKAGISPEKADPDQIACAMTVTSVTPTGTINRITKLDSSLLTAEKIEGRDERISDYYPTRYKITLDYGMLGYDTATGNALFRAILDVYTEQFVEKSRIDFAFAETDGELSAGSMEYDKAIFVLTSRLNKLNRYLDSLINTEAGDFRSAETGTCFRDLRAEAAALRDQDLKNLSRFITDRHVSLNPVQKENEYRYLAEETEMKSQAFKERLVSLNRLIDGYARKREIVVGASGTLSASKAAQGEIPFTSGTYELFQTSNVYDRLIQLRLRLQSELTETQDNNHIYSAWLTSETAPSETDKAYVESEIARISDRVQMLTENIGKTAEEYDRTYRLNQTVQVRSLTKGENFPVRRLLSASLSDIAAAEAALFGCFILLAVLLAYLDGRRGRKA